MDRPIVYPTEGVADTDFLTGFQAAMIGQGWLTQALLGAATLCTGLACTPSTGLAVSIAPGAIYSQRATEPTSYGSLPVNNNPIVKQGLSLNPIIIGFTPSLGTGQSINYLIQATYEDLDGATDVLPYYNSANPSVPYSGPSNSGAAQSTLRQGICSVFAKAGVAAATGSQTTPTEDANYVGLYVVTINHGDTTVSTGSISTAVPNSPALITETLTQKISQATADARYLQSVPAASTTTAGILKLATTAVAEAGVDTTTALTPADLAYVLGLANFNSKIHGNLSSTTTGPWWTWEPSTGRVDVWGAYESPISSETQITVNYPVNIGRADWGMATIINADSTDLTTAQIASQTTTTLTVQINDQQGSGAAHASGFFWEARGYSATLPS